MASLLFTVSGAVGNALAFAFIFSRLTVHGAEERKRHYLALEKLQRAKNEWNRDRMKRLDFINRRLGEKNEAKAFINNVDEGVLEYYCAFSKQIKYLPPEPELSDLYHPSENQKNGELLFVVAGTGIATYVLYKHLK